METITKICPKCQTEYSIKYQFKIDADTDIELAKESLAGNISMHICPNCGLKQALDVPVYYQNIRKKFIVYYIPETYMNMIDKDIITNPAISNLPGGISGRYTSSPEFFTDTINAFEATGSDNILDNIATQKRIPQCGLIEI